MLRLSLLLLVAALVLATASADPCVFSKGQLYRYEQMIACFETVPFDRNVRDVTINALMLGYENFQEGLDLSRDPPQDVMEATGYQGRDIIADLKALKDREFDYDYEFQFAINEEVLQPLGDAHTHYITPRSYAAFALKQPVAMLSYVQMQGQEESSAQFHLEVAPCLNDELVNYFLHPSDPSVKPFNVSSLIGLEVTRINDLPAVEYLLDFARKRLLLTRDIGTNLFSATAKTWAGAAADSKEGEGHCQLVEGAFASRSFSKGIRPRDLELTYTFQSYSASADANANANTNTNTAPKSVTVTFPWLVQPALNITSSEHFLSLWGKTQPSLLSRSSAVQGEAQEAKVKEIIIRIDSDNTVTREEAPQPQSSPDTDKKMFRMGVVDHKDDHLPDLTITSEEASEETEKEKLMAAPHPLFQANPGYMHPIRSTTFPPSFLGQRQLELADQYELIFSTPRWPDFKVYLVKEQPVPSAVLVLRSFMGVSDGSECEMLELIYDAADAMRKRGVQKLVVDFSNNGGGIICIFTELFDVLFPKAAGVLDPAGGTSNAEDDDLDAWVYDIKSSDLVVRMAEESLTTPWQHPWSGPFWRQRNDDAVDQSIDWLEPGRKRHFAGDKKEEEQKRDRFSRPLYLPCDRCPGMAEMRGADFLEPENIIIMTNGLCGSTCACFTLAARLKANATVLTFESMKEHKQQMVSFPGGMVSDWATVNEAASAIGLLDEPGGTFKLPSSGNFRMSAVAAYLSLQPESETPAVDQDKLAMPFEWTLNYGDVNIKIDRSMALKPEQKWMTSLQILNQKLKRSQGQH